MEKNWTAKRLRRLAWIQPQVPDYAGQLWSMTTIIDILNENTDCTVTVIVGMPPSWCTMVSIRGLELLLISTQKKKH